MPESDRLPSWPLGVNAEQFTAVQINAAIAEAQRAGQVATVAALRRLPRYRPVTSKTA